MKIISIIFFVAAFIFTITAISAYFKKIKIEKFNLTVFRLIAIAVICVLIGFVLLCEKPVAILYIVAGVLLINIIRFISDRDGD